MQHVRTEASDEISSFSKMASLSAGSSRSLVAANSCATASTPFDSSRHAKTTRMPWLRDRGSQSLNFDTELWRICINVTFVSKTRHVSKPRPEFAPVTMAIRLCEYSYLMQEVVCRARVAGVDYFCPVPTRSEAKPKSSGACTRCHTFSMLEAKRRCTYCGAGAIRTDLESPMRSMYLQQQEN